MYSNSRYGVSIAGAHSFGAIQDLEIETSGQGGLFVMNSSSSGVTGLIVSGNRIWRNTNAGDAIYDEVRFADNSNNNKAHYEVNFYGNYIEGGNTTNKRARNGLRLDGNVQKSQFKNNIFGGDYTGGACNGTGSNSGGLQNQISGNSGNCTP